MTWPTLTLARGLWLVLLCGNIGGASSAAVQSPSSCPSRTVNYITHSLAQQCHKTSWSTPKAPQAEDSKTSAVSSSGSVTSTRSVESSDNSFVPDNAPTTVTERLTAFTVTDKQQISSASPVSEDVESALGNSNFLSFEEWKKQNLAKLGQSAEHIGKKHDKSNEHRKRPTNIHTSLDSLGDDAEIDLNFGGFAAEVPEAPNPTQWGRTVSGPPADQMDESEAPPKVKPRNKDAGTTCKERFNYASFDCAATVLKANPQASGQTSILVEKNRDSYMLNECKADNKFVILELCDDIAIDTIVLANFEFFSSTFRTFRVSVSDRYPVKLDKWKTLGTYEARNSREIQAFLVENPMIWARYLRIEFLTHYGSEFYCPVSLVRVHGTTMMEDYKHNEEAAQADEEEELEDDTLQGEAGETLTPDAVAQPILEEQASKYTATESIKRQETADVQPHSQDTVSAKTTSGSYIPMATSPKEVDKDRQANIPALFSPSESTCAPIKIQTETSFTSSGSSPSLSSTAIKASTQAPSSGSESISTTSSSSITTSASLQGNKSASSASKVASAANLDTNNASRTHSSAKSSPDTAHTKSSSTQPHAPNPTIQESFYKSVQKRLQMLESNSSLSLQYIEEQSRILREAFNKVEQKQLSKTTSFLNILNATVLNELRDFRQQYDQIWQSTVIELETQREQYQREVLAINSRLSILADEVIFQKRMSILQSVLVLLSLALVLFSRGALNTYLELPIVQNVMARSPSFGVAGSPDTPGTPTSRGRFSSLRSRAFRNRRQERTATGDSREDTVSPTIAYSPPTPTSQYGESDGDETDTDADRAHSPVPSFESIERPRSSPGILTTAGNGQSPGASALSEQAIKPMASIESLGSGYSHGLRLDPNMLTSEESLGVPER